MKAISLREPWATLIAHGLKRWETRSWYTSYRGSLAIHATKRRPRWDEINPTIEQALFDVGYRGLAELPLGCVICIVNLVDCEPTDEVVKRTFFQEIAREPLGRELHFGDYTPGRFAWQMDTPILVRDIPARGSQGFWEWKPDGDVVALPSYLQGELL
jgi:hypothetical protein